jgi:DNA-binding beta-propeller fold protein YncE
MRCCLVLLVLLLALSAQASPADSCNQPAADATVFLPLPGSPFSAIPSADGCWIFVTLTNAAGGPPTGVAVIGRKNGVASVERVISTGGSPTGAVLTHDGKLLIVASDDRVFFLDTQRMIKGKAGALAGELREPAAAGRRIGAVYVNVTLDDDFLFISDEYAQRIRVLNLKQAHHSGLNPTAIVGTIPTGRLPIALTFSPDGRYLYTTSEAAAEAWGWPADCKPEGRAADSAPQAPQGAIVVIDVARARKNPAESVVAKVPAGCSAVRLALSPKGDVAYVTARNANAVLAFDTAKLLSDSPHALIGSVPVGVAPVGVVVVDAGSKVLAANSNRFAASPSDHSTLTVIDAGKIAAGAGAVLGTVAAGAFPREMRVTADGKTLLVTNYASNSLEMIDVSRMPVQK